MRIKRLLFSLLIALMMFSLIAFATSAEDNTSLDISAEVTSDSSAVLSKGVFVTTEDGLAIKVALRIDSNPGITTVMGKLTYDGKALEYLGFEEGDIFSTENKDEYGITDNGAIVNIFIRSNDPRTNYSSTGTLVTLKFFVKKGFDGDISSIAIGESMGAARWNSDTLSVETVENKNLNQCGTIKVHSYVKDASTAATCTEPAKISYKCSKCNDIHVVETGVANGHTWTPATCLTPETCEICGATQGTAAGAHDFADATCTTPKTCKREGCGATEGTALGHTEVSIPAVEATCTTTGLSEGKKCSVCGEITLAQQTTPEKGHTEVEIPKIDPTCTEIGYTAGVKCSVCDAVITAPQPVNPLNHVIEMIPAVEATCTKVGYTAGAKCSRCEEVLTAPVEVSKKAHTVVVDAAKAPTCTETGLTEGSHCSVCNEVLVEQEIVAPNGHNKEIPVAEKAPTCTETGLTAGFKCSVCGYISDQEVVPAKGHTASQYKAPTCTEPGYAAGGVCSVCGETLPSGVVFPATGHNKEFYPATGATGDVAPTILTENLIEATCTAMGSYDEVTYCTTCKVELSREQKNIDKLPHTIVVDAAVAPTCTETGLTEGSHCSVCNEVLVEQEVVMYPGHSTEIIPKVEPTCTENGYEVGIKCSVCGEILTAPVEIAALGHTEVVDAAVAPTCTTTGLTEGKHCSVCNEVFVAQEEVAALGHTEVVDAAVAPTCTETGLTEGKHCSVCNEVIVAQEVVEALGHTEVVDAAVAPTCTATGLTEGKHCSVCNEVLVAQEEVAALGHTEETLAAVAPTCTETGLTEGVKCSVCEEILTAQEEVAALGHTYGDWVVTTTPTTTAEGEETKTCSVCQDKQTRPVKKLPVVTNAPLENWEKGNGGLSFKSDAAIEDFEGILVNGKLLSSENYSISEDGVITLSEEYLKTLENGTYTIGIKSANGVAESTFTVENSNGWVVAVIIIAAVVVCAGVAVVVVFYKKKKAAN